jgi:hypothetical protein
MSKHAWVLLAVLPLAGCPEEEETETAPTPTTVATEPTVQESATPLVPATASAANPAIEPRAKAELDNKDPTNTTGATVAAEGGKATFVAPTGWTAAKSGTWNTVASSDQKTKFAAGGFAAGEDPTAKLSEAASALGYTECSWATGESISMGKDKLPATVADGVCKRDGNPVRTAYATLSGDGMSTVAMGGWDAPGGNAAEMFEIFRNVKKAAVGGDPTGIAACCQALQQNAASAPPEQKGAYIAAAGACNAVRSSPQGRAALAGVRALLAGANVPAPCR